MIKQGIKNYFVSLKYVFTPLGVFALGVILGLSIFIPATIAAVSKLFDDVVEIVGAVDADLNGMWTYIVAAVRALDWSDPLAAVKIMFTEKWMTSVLNGALDSLLGGKTAFEAQITAAVEKCLSAVLSGAVVFAVFAVLGLVCGFWFTKWLIRRDIAKRNLWKWALMTLADAALSAALVVIAVWLASLWRASAFISAITSIILVSVFALMEAYLAHGRKKVPFKQAVNFKNVFKLLITDSIVFLLSFAIALIAALINITAGIFIGVSFIAIAIIVTGLNAEAYVKALSLNAEKADATEEQKAAA